MGSSHPAVWVAIFGPKFSDQLSSSSEELLMRMFFVLVYLF